MRLPSASIPASVVKYVVDSSKLDQYREEVARLRDDSAGLARQFAIVARARRATARIDTIRDTTKERDTVCLAGEDVRSVLIEDSALVVQRDSARNVLAECEFDREALLDSIQERREPSDLPRKVALFSTGAVVGGVAAFVALWSLAAQ